MLWINIIDHLFYITIILFTLQWFLPIHHLLIKMFTIDSLFCTYHFFRTFINNNISESQIVKHSNLIYEGSTLDRYILYVCEYLFYKIICILFWVEDISIIYYFLILTIIPSILNKIIKCDIFSIIKKEKEKMVKIIISKQFAQLINFFSKIYLNKDINIKHKELLSLLNNYKDTIDYFFIVLKNVLIILLLLYIKNYSPNFYYRITKYIYNYKSKEMLISFNAESAKNMLVNIIDNKQWIELLKPNVYKAIFYLYQINEEKTDLLRKFITNFNYTLLKMFTIWTISSFLNNIIIVPLISLFLLIYKKGKYIVNDSKSILQIGVIICSILIGWHIKSFFLTSLCCQFGYILIFNKIIYSVYRLIMKKIKKWTYRIYINNKNYIVPIILDLMNIASFSFFSPSYIILLIPTHVIYIGILTNNMINSLIFVLMTLFGFFSKFNIFHIILVTIIIFIILSFNENQIIELILNKIKIIYYHRDEYKRLIKLRSNKLKNKIKLYLISFRNTIITIIYDKNKKIIVKILNLIKMSEIRNFFTWNNMKKILNQNIKQNLDYNLDHNLGHNLNHIEIDINNIFNLSNEKFIEAISVNDFNDLQNDEKKEESNYEGNRKKIYNIKSVENRNCIIIEDYLSLSSN